MPNLIKFRQEICGINYLSKRKNDPYQTISLLGASRQNVNFFTPVHRLQHPLHNLSQSWNDHPHEQSEVQARTWSTLTKLLNTQSPSWQADVTSLGVACGHANTQVADRQPYMYAWRAV
jgi:hypothetical protein